jgi:dextranase
MRLTDFYPSKGSFSPGELVTFLIELETTGSQEITVQMFIQHLADLPIVIERSFHIAGQQTIQMQWMPLSKPAGYSAGLKVSSATESGPLYGATAFDILSHWTDFPRYGFLTDFSASRADPETVLSKLARFHINGLQLYDWQYRHDQLLAPSKDYIDPLGREMSLASVRALVDAAHRHGMAAMPYLAIYAASAEFWRAHPDWALYDEAGSPIPFGENFLGLMDPSAGSPWSEHLLAEGARALQEIPFDGLHIDQYGEPKQAWDAHHNSVDMPRAFVDFIQSASNQHPDKTILFNAVGNWPINALAESAAGFMYIEIWPPDVEYLHVAEIVLNAVRRSHGEAVIIALYLPASHSANNLLADAVILACGGTRIELGENTRLLSDPYFPKHEEISPEVESELRKFYDFAVRDGEWLRPYTLPDASKETWTRGELNPDFISTDNSIWVVARKYSGSLVLQLVNLSGLDPHQRWDEEHALPNPCENMTVRVEMNKYPSQILWDAPENTIGPQSLSFEYDSGTLTFQIPHIYLTGLVAIHE